VSEIEALAAKVETLSSSADSWNKVMLRCLAITAIAAVLTFIATRQVIVKTSLAADAQKELSDAKDRVLQADLKSKDLNIASLEVQALGLRKELLLQGPRANLLVGDNRHTLISALKHFSGQKIDVRRNAFIFAVNGKPVSSTPIGDDTEGFAKALTGLFKDATWNVLADDPLLSSFTGRGIVVGIATDAPDKTESVAKALVMALSAGSITVSGPARLPELRFKRVGADTLAPLDSTTIVLEVMSRE
jgi:hypothetical protein